jgi:hypothetical protein
MNLFLNKRKNSYKISKGMYNPKTTDRFLKHKRQL